MPDMSDKRKMPGVSDQLKLQSHKSARAPLFRGLLQKIIEKARALLGSKNRIGPKEGSPSIQARFKIRSSNPNYIRRSLFGHSKRYVIELMGPPMASVEYFTADSNILIQSSDRSAGKKAGDEALPSIQEYWQSDTWYYPVDPKNKRAIALMFLGDRVSRMQFLGESNWKK